ncbi:hypothetical protein PR048_025319 [Dryococelus australis]|uniref:Transposase n=1 Tax=Dryococelus australis TaxID=614101 RepID=A0ABQ9GR31_9NEOP|nr:hypothetical protein PR048_025319 [Dryococelus australis]
MHHWPGDNPHVLTEAPLHPQKHGVWCAVSSRRIIPVLFHETVNSARYIEHMFNVSAEQLTENDRNNAYFQQDGATTHTACSTIARIESVFQPVRVISRGTNQPIPPRSPDFYVSTATTHTHSKNSRPTLSHLSTPSRSMFSPVPFTSFGVVCTPASRSIAVTSSTYSRSEFELKRVRC